MWTQGPACPVRVISHTSTDWPRRRKKYREATKVLNIFDLSIGAFRIPHSVKSNSNSTNI